MRHQIFKPTALLALVCAAGLTLYGCNRDYESDDDATATDQYGETGTGTGTGDTGLLDMDAGADDSAIKDRVDAQLRNDARFRDVSVDVDDGIVTIDGQVANPADLDAVHLLIQQTEGVREVRLDVDVESGMQDDDDLNNPTR